MAQAIDSNMFLLLLQCCTSLCNWQPKSTHKQSTAHYAATATLSYRFSSSMQPVDQTQALNQELHATQPDTIRLATSWQLHMMSQLIDRNAPDAAVRQTHWVPGTNQRQHNICGPQRLRVCEDTNNPPTMLFQLPPDSLSTHTTITSSTDGRTPLQSAQSDSNWGCSLGLGETHPIPAGAYRCSSAGPAVLP